MFIHLESLAWIIGGGIAVLGYFLYSQSYSLSAASPQADPGSLTTKSSKAPFHASRLTNCTFLIKEYNDVYSEHPHIYAKVVPAANTILLIDTGCGGASADSEIVIRSLKQFVEVMPVDSNDGKPLNEHGRMGYVVALTHCHYDHILAVEQFNDWPILASGHSPDFLAKEAIPEHSLCKSMGIRTPTYAPVLVPDRYAITAPGSKTSLGVIILHTPGHTPDEIALFDEEESMLYVGDSLYEYEHIIFPGEGSIVTWFSSMDFLVAFVKERNALIPSAPAAGPKEVLINSGHVTALRPALNVLFSAIAFMKDVVDGKEVVKDRDWRRGEAVVTYEQDGGRFSLRTPERLVLEARNEKETSEI